MFDIVADVGRYPEFVPLCTAMHVRSEEQRKGRRILIADMSVGYKSIAETFTSQVIIDPQASEITSKYIDGPFRYLRNEWRFLAPDDTGGRIACDVDFSIDYEFRNRALGMLMGAMFERAFARFTAAFEARADEIYGDKTA